MKDAPHVERDRLSDMLPLGSRMLMPICSVSLMWTLRVWPWRSVMIDGVDFCLDSWLFVLLIVLFLLATIIDLMVGFFGSEILRAASHSESRRILLLLSSTLQHPTITCE
jgi:hypothetical protein